MSGSAGIVDWGLAERTAASVAGTPGPMASSYGDAELEAMCEEAIAAAAGYARMPVPDERPRAELVDRRQWSATTLQTLAVASESLEHQLEATVPLPGLLGDAVRRVIGIGAGVEAGLAVGYAARRVLGQYDVALFGPERAPRLLFVAPNLEHARADLDADRRLFLRWVALHETTHVLQFAAVPWLVPHLRDMAGTLIDQAATGIDPARIASLTRRFLRDPRALIRTILRGELAHALADAEGRATLDRLQATMAVIEGHAEHVMDACAADDRRLAGLRSRLDKRRSARGGLAEVLARLLGMDLKLRQYALGKRFWDEVVGERGDVALEQVWRSPASLPSLAELDDPAAWLDRTSPPVTAW